MMENASITHDGKSILSCMTSKATFYANFFFEADIVLHCGMAAAVPTAEWHAQLGKIAYTIAYRCISISTPQGLHSLLMEVAHLISSSAISCDREFGAKSQEKDSLSPSNKHQQKVGYQSSMVGLLAGVSKRKIPLPITYTHLSHPAAHQRFL